MEVNEGSTNCIIRIIVGLALISLVFIGPQSPWGWIGLLPLTTGPGRHAGKASCAQGRKPPYRLSLRSGQFSISTKRTRFRRYFPVTASEQLNSVEIRKLA
jgi:hypothetical protein